MNMEPRNSVAKQPFWQEVGSSELSSSFDRNLGIPPEKDIMSIVMKRRLGGCNSGIIESDSFSPVKKLRTDVDSPAGIEDNQPARGPLYDEVNTNIIGGSCDSVIDSPFHLAGTDSFKDRDSFTLSNFQGLNSEGFIGSKTDPEVASLPEISVHQVKDELDEQNSHDTFEKADTGQVLNETTRNPESLEFAYSSINGYDNSQISLNDIDFTLLKTLDNTDYTDPSETKSGECGFDTSSFSIRESSLNVIDSCEPDVIETESDTPERCNLQVGLNTNNSNSKVGLTMEDTAPVQKHEESENIQECGAISEDRISSDNEEILDDGLSPNHSSVKAEGIEEFGNVTENECKENAEAVESSVVEPERVTVTDITPNIVEEPSGDGDSTTIPADEVDSLNVYLTDPFQTRIEVKKSRKQNKPKRMAKVESSNQVATSTSSLLLNINKPEKSRKQNIPKRIITETDYECCYDDGNQEEIRHSDEDENDNFVNDNFQAIDYFANNSQSDTQEDEDTNVEVSTVHNQSKETSECEDGDNKNGGIFESDKTNSNSSIETSENKSHGFSFNMSQGVDLPLHFQTALLSYSNQLPHSPIINDLAVEKLLEHGQTDLTENLEVVKRLREIRFNRYRKISVEEKREIAEYAKVNGVSSAAAYFGVSKSAVSMWTRIDFSEISEDKSKKKKINLIGNKKFEELVLRVQQEKPHKFKGLSREEKFEVSRYAKLVGVREMARCLGIALGTVSGWMRQFPYLMKPANQEEISHCGNTSSESSQEAANSELKPDLIDIKTERDSVENSSDNKLDIKKKAKSDKTVLKETNDVPSPIVKIEKEMDTISGNEEAEFTSSSRFANKEGETKGKEHEDAASDHESGKKSNKRADEIDELIAETFDFPDADKCFEDAKQYLQGSPLENDTFFEQLFKRVVECRSDKYKSLKASEKLEVVRYAKRIGVRRIAKILGLATGTLSGWTTRYQAHLGLTSDVLLDMNQANTSLMSDLDSSLDASQNVSTGNINDSLNESQSSSLNNSSYMISPSSAMLDNPERAEVTAVKLILKDRFEYLRDKIDIARKIKFKNMTRDEKIEVVKCTKLAGIRPTARVLNMPIGTLSGWITKHTAELHPVYQQECDRLGGPAIHRPSKSQHPSSSYPGSQSYYFNVMNSQWPGLQHLPSLYSMPGVDSGQQEGNPPVHQFPVFPSKPNNSASEKEQPMNDSVTNAKLSNDPPNTSRLNKLSYKSGTKNSEMPKRQTPGNSNEVLKQSYSVDNVIDQLTNEDATGTVNKHSKHGESDHFEEDAKHIAANYLQSIYKRFGLS